MEGQFEFAYRYSKEIFDNYNTLSQHSNQYHIMGPSTGFPDGGGHFVLNEFGDLIYGNVLRNIQNGSGIDFGCSVQKNGLIIRRHNNTLIACDENQNVVWAKEFISAGHYSFIETKPLALNDGFVHVLSNANELVLFKMDFNGNLVWSIKGHGRHYNLAPVMKAGLVSFLWRSINADGTFTSSYLELDHSDGSIVFNKSLSLIHI